MVILFFPFFEDSRQICVLRHPYGAAILKLFLSHVRYSASHLLVTCVLRNHNNGVKHLNHDREIAEFISPFR